MSNDIFKFVQISMKHLLYKGMKTVGVTIYTQISQCKHFKGGIDIIISKLNTLKSIVKYSQNRGCRSSMCEQSLCKV